MKKQDQERALLRGVDLSPKCTPRMVAYLDGLFAMCGFGTRVQRNLYMQRITGRDVRFVDALTYDEGHKLIGLLEAIRDGARADKPVVDEEGELDKDWNRR